MFETYKILIAFFLSKHKLKHKKCWMILGNFDKTLLIFDVLIITINDFARIMVHVDSSNVTNEDNNNYFKFDKLVLYEKIHNEELFVSEFA